MKHTHRTAEPGVACVVAILLLPLLARVCEAAPRQIRVVWNVAAMNACVYQLTLDEPWAMPESVTPDACGNAGTARPVSGEPTKNVIVRKGDYVTVYAVHYNPVSYKPKDGKVLVLQPDEPEAISILDLVIRLASGKGVKTLSVADRQRLALTDEDPSCNFSTADGAAPCLDLVGRQLRALQMALSAWHDTWAYRAAWLADDLARAPRVLRTQEWAQARAYLGDRAVSERMRERARELGRPDPDLDLQTLAADFSCSNSLSPLGNACRGDGFVEEVQLPLRLATVYLALYDSSIATSCARSADCPGGGLDARRRRLGTGLEAALGLLDTGGKSALSAPLGTGMASLQASFRTLKTYRNALAAEAARNYFVELPSKNDVGRLNTLVFTLPLQDQGGTALTFRTLTVRVEPDYPLVLASAGLMWLPTSGVDFRQLAIVQEPRTDSAGNTTLVKMLRSEDAGGGVRTVAGLLAAGVRCPDRVCRSVARPLYLTVGTTVDNDIFRTLMVGAACFVPRWRSSIVVGALRTAGATEDDLKDTIGRYSVEGVALKDLDPSKVPIPSVPHWKLVIGWTLSAF
jgi:hypothetical protein